MSLILQMSLKHFPRDQNLHDLPSLDIGFGKVVARSSSCSTEAPKVDSSGASIPETKDDAALVLLTSEENQLNASSKPLSGRSNCSLAYFEKESKLFIYVFGGLNQSSGWLNDCWKGEISQNTG